MDSSSTRNGMDHADEEPAARAARMAATNILISSLNGLGMEIAKNIILGGVKSVCLNDQGHVEISDLASQSFMREEDVGKNRVDVCRPWLAELNMYVDVTSHTGQLNREVLSQLQVIIMTEGTLADSMAINDICRQNNANFLLCKTFGLVGQIFCDFGPDFTVLDCNGEPPISCMVSLVTHDEKGVVTAADEARRGLEDGDCVTFQEVQGMEELNHLSEPLRIKYINPYSFAIGDTTQYSPYMRGGVVTQVKMAKHLHFKTFRESLNQPSFVDMDIAKWGRPQQLHLAILALDEYGAQHKGQSPRPHHQQDAQDFLAACQTVKGRLSSEALGGLEALGEGVLATVAKTCRGDLCPVQSVMGSITAQEVSKACSGKFHPVFQFLYFDALECLPDTDAPPADAATAAANGATKNGAAADSISEEEAQARSSRYDGQYQVFSKDFVDQLQASKWFFVGLGVIGCDLLKNFNMMGLDCSLQGRIIITVTNTIEKSNLNGLFLFRPHGAQRIKSNVAPAAVEAMNPKLNTVSHQNRAGPADTEKIYGFFEGLDGVANALDNVDARMYMDRRCVFYKKPLLESGTLVTKGNVQVVIPHLIQRYSSFQEPTDAPSADGTSEKKGWFGRIVSRVSRLFSRGSDRDTERQSKKKLTHDIATIPTDPLPVAEFWLLTFANSTSGVVELLLWVDQQSTEVEHLRGGLPCTIWPVMTFETAVEYRRHAAFIEAKSEVEFRVKTQQPDRVNFILGIYGTTGSKLRMSAIPGRRGLDEHKRHQG